MNKKIYILSIVFTCIVVGWFSCKKAYDPKIVAGVNNYLVVETAINTCADPTVIHLSRTVPISSNSGAVPETGAVVSIISDANVTYPVIETSNGYYSGASINAAGPAKYSIKIATKEGETYQSDFVEAKNSPPIDSVYFKVVGNGINVYADTHDPTNNSRYYLWNYTETYEFVSAFNSSAILQQIPQDTIVFRPPSEEIHYCWRTDTSSTLLLNSSAKLTNDVISQNVLTSIASTDEKIAVRYSILVNQFVLTTDAYNYYQQLKKNTEQLGSIFDPQPSELPGNVHCLTNPSEPVIGYVTAGSAAQSRIFIDSRSLPNWIENSPYGECKLDTLLYARPVPGTNSFINEVAEDIYTGLDVPIYAIGPPGAPPIGWSASTRFCVDCTVRGTNVRPLFWTDYTE
jgi:hypothetical protein